MNEEQEEFRRAQLRIASELARIFDLPLNEWKSRFYSIAGSILNFHYKNNPNKEYSLKFVLEVLDMIIEPIEFKDEENLRPLIFGILRNEKAKNFDWSSIQFVEDLTEKFKSDF